MSREDPSRLSVAGATDLERRLLVAGAGELPPPELTARMARGLGLATRAAPAVPPARPALPWPAISSAVMGVALTVAVIGWSRDHHPAPPAPAPAVARITAPPAPAVAPDAPPPAEPVRHRRRASATTGPADLRAEIALIDAARTAVSDGGDARALALLARHDATFPDGAFRPEAAALRIQALAHLGQHDRARALGRAFIAAHPDSPLIARVQAAIAGDPR